MTNVYKTPEKRATRRGLFRFAEASLEAKGWTVSRIPRAGKASLRQIAKAGQTHTVSIRTSQDAWIAFPPKVNGEGFVTLDEVDFVVASSVNDKHNPTEVKVHMIPGDIARDSFQRALAARREADHVLPDGRGIWLSLYDEDTANPVSLVGAGLGLESRWLIGRHDLSTGALVGEARESDEADPEDDPHPRPSTPSVTPVRGALSIGEAKALLAASLGVPVEAIKITIEH